MSDKPRECAIILCDGTLPPLVMNTMSEAEAVIDMQIKRGNKPCALHVIEYSAYKDKCRELEVWKMSVPSYDQVVKERDEARLDIEMHKASVVQWRECAEKRLDERNILTADLACALVDLGKARAEVKRLDTLVNGLQVERYKAEAQIDKLDDKSAKLVEALEELAGYSANNSNADFMAFVASEALQAYAKDSAGAE